MNRTCTSTWKMKGKKKVGNSTSAGSFCLSDCVSIRPSTVVLFGLGIYISEISEWYLYYEQIGRGEERRGVARDRIGEERMGEPESVCGCSVIWEKEWLKYWRLSPPFSTYILPFLFFSHLIPSFSLLLLLSLISPIPPHISLFLLRFLLLPFLFSPCLSPHLLSLWINRRRAGTLSDICRNKRLKYKHSYPEGERRGERERVDMREKETERKAVSLNEKQNKGAMERWWKTIRLEKKEGRE